MFTVANWSVEPTGAAVAAGAGTAGFGAGATVEDDAAPGVRLMVLVCRSRSGAGGIARLTVSSPLVEGGLLEMNIGTISTASAMRTAAPSRRVFKTGSKRAGDPRTARLYLPLPPLRPNRTRLIQQAPPRQQKKSRRRAR